MEKISSITKKPLYQNQLQHKKGIIKLKTNDGVKNELQKEKEIFELETDEEVKPDCRIERQLMN